MTGERCCKLKSVGAICNVVRPPGLSAAEAKKKLATCEQDMKEFFSGQTERPVKNLNRMSSLQNDTCLYSYFCLNKGAGHMQVHERKAVQPFCREETLSP